MSDWFIVPVRSLASGKSRLAGVLGAAERRALNTMLMNGVLEAIARSAGGLDRCIVVSADRDALQLARQLGAMPVPEGPQPGLNVALETARAEARSRQASSILILAADLPDANPTALDHLREATPRGSAAIVADKRGDGTNALLLPADCSAKFAFGEASLARHRDAIESSGVAVAVWNDPALAFDIDSPDDFLRWKESRHRDRSSPSIPGTLDSTIPANDR
jgi:2-phospho-L-lactate guanylyltransferase